MAETRTYQGHTYSRSGPGQPWQLTGAAPAGVTYLAPPNPKFPLEVNHQRGENTIQEHEIGRQGALDSKANSDANKAAYDATDAAARARYSDATAKAQRDKAQADAIIANQKADEAQANTALQTMSANSNVHGDAYLKQFVPPSMWNIVKAYARGDLGSRAGSMSTSMLPIIQHAMNYDPSASGTNFPARVAMQTQLSRGDPNSIGGGLRSMEQMLLHGANVLDAGLALHNFHSGLAAPLNHPWQWSGKLIQAPSLATFNQAVTNYGPESQKAVAGGLGGEQERLGRLAALSPTMTPEALAAGLQSDARMAMERAGAINDQYKRVMGRDITDALSPEAKAAYDKIMAGGYDDRGRTLHPVPGWAPIANAGGPSAPPPGGDTAAPNQPGLAPTGGNDRTFYTRRDQDLADETHAAFVKGATREQIDAIAARYGARKFGPDLDQAIELRDKQGFVGAQFRPSPTGHEEGGLTNKIANAVGTNYGSFATGLANATTFGQLGNIAKLSGGSSAGTDLAMDLSRENVLPYMGGEIAGSILPTAGLSRGLRAGAELTENPFARSVLTSRPTAGAAYGGLYGASSSDNPVEGALIGAGLSLAGDYGASKIGSAAARAFSPSVAEALSSGERSILASVNKTGRDAVADALNTAADLNVPASLADVSPEVNSLTAAAIRRSPTAGGQARDVLLPRNRGQYDRMVDAVNTHLGPIENIPQRSDDLIAQARKAAGPLYDAAYAQSVPTTPELEAMLATPFGRQSLARARTIAANERRSPTELGFGLDGEGNVLLNPQPNAAIARHLDARAALDEAQEAYRKARLDPTADLSSARAAVESARGSLRFAQAGLASAPDPAAAASVPAYTTQTLDYVKRGMDDVLEQYRSPVTGRLMLDEAGRAQNTLKNQFLAEVDRLNPHYAAARGAYAGPAAERDALAMGQDATTLSPDQLGLNVANATPTQVDQMRLGFQSQLAENAGKLRYSTNPFESVLGTPAMEQRLGSLYDTDSVQQLMARRDLENRLAASSNSLIGNSMTAQRQIADQAFATDPLVEGAMHAGAALATHGASLPMTAMRVAGPTLRDRIALGLGQRAVQKADQIIPIALNPDPQQSVASLLAMEQKQQDYTVARALSSSIGAQRGSRVGDAVAASLIPYATAN